MISPYYGLPTEYWLASNLIRFWRKGGIILRMLIHRMLLGVRRMLRMVDGGVGIPIGRLI